MTEDIPVTYDRHGLLIEATVTLKYFDPATCHDGRYDEDPREIGEIVDIEISDSDLDIDRLYIHKNGNFITVRDDIANRAFDERTKR